MNADIIKQWEKNKDSFRDILERAIVKKTFQYEYKFLVALLVKYIINEKRGDEDYKDLEYDLKDDPSEIATVTLGEWNGDYLFIIKPVDNYCTVRSLWLTKVFYGSCSGCDIMLDAEYRSNKKEKMDLLMKLSLEIIQEFKPLSLIYPF